jgi:hypothetical protein
MALGAEPSFAATGIRTGVHPHPEANPTNPTVAGGFKAFARGVDHRPYYLAEWNNTNVSQKDALIDWFGEDILTQVANAGAHLFFNMEIEPDFDAGYVYADLWDGAPTQSGENPDQYVMNIAKHLKAWTKSTGHIVPVRLLHEFNAQFSGWGGPDYMKRYWKRWVTILKGGDVAGRLEAMGQPPLRTTDTVAANDKLRFVWCPLAVDPNVNPAWRDYWPGERWVNYVGADIYPSSYPDRRAAQFQMLGEVHTFAANHRKRFCIPEFNWGAHGGDDRPWPVKELLDWIIARANVEFIAQFEYWVEFNVTLHSDPHPMLRKLYTAYYAKSNFS